jgi:RimJ/RimL family protein N-acetyltransferase
LIARIPRQFESERLTIRAPKVRDAEEMHAAVLESLESLRPWMRWANRPQSLKGTRDFLRSSCRDWGSGTEFGLPMLLKGTSTFVGWMGLFRIDWSVPRVEIGYWVRKRFEGHGYITEALNAVTDYCADCLGARRVELHVDERNERSIRVADRCGYQLEGILRNYVRAEDGSLENTRFYSRLFSDDGPVGLRHDGSSPAPSSVPPPDLQIPEQFESQQLIIRAPRVDDAKEVNAAVRESLDMLAPWMPWANRAPTMRESKENQKAAREKFLAREDFRLNAFLKGTNTFVLGSGLHRVDFNVPKVEIGYWVRKQFAGQGYVTEAVNAITDFAFREFNANRVEIRMDDDNVLSWRVAERCGFEREALLRNERRKLDGSLGNTRVYSKVR